MSSEKKKKIAWLFLQIKFISILPTSQQVTPQLDKYMDAVARVSLWWGSPPPAFFLTNKSCGSLNTILREKLHRMPLASQCRLENTSAAAIWGTYWGLGKAEEREYNNRSITLSNEQPASAAGLPNRVIPLLFQRSRITLKRPCYSCYIKVKNRCATSEQPR